MKNFFVFLTSALIIITLLIGCKKKETADIVFGCTDPNSSSYNPLATIDDGSCRYDGKATFWYNSNGTNATVIVGNQVGYITKYYSTYNPTCGSDGCANFTLPIGTYSFHATSSWSTWNGNVTITANGCALVLLQ